MKRAVCLLNINKEGILSVTRKEDQTKFCMPGGKVEDDETSLEAIIREIFEETGIILKEEELEIVFEGFDTPEKDFWTTVYQSKKENLKPIQKEKGVIPFFVNKKEFLGENACFLNFNKLLFEKGCLNLK